jgi:hypothetical protein
LNALRSSNTLGNNPVSGIAYPHPNPSLGRIEYIKRIIPRCSTRSVVATLNNRDLKICHPSTAAQINMKASTICTYLFATTATAKWWIKEEPSCAVITGAAEGIAYRYYSHSHFAQPCVTSEMTGPIRLSLEHSMKKLDLDCLPDSTCMPVDYDGNWNNGAWKGYLLYGPQGKVNLAKYCGPSLEYELKPSCSKSSTSKSEL